MWAQKSTQIERLESFHWHHLKVVCQPRSKIWRNGWANYLMMMTFMLVMSMVRPHQCIKPQTLRQLKRTHLQKWKFVRSFFFECSPELCEARTSCQGLNLKTPLPSPLIEIGDTKGFGPFGEHSSKWKSSKILTKLF